EHADTLKSLRETLYGWMLETHDPGLIPQPILEDWGREHGSKYAAMRRPEAAEAVRRSMATIEAGERGDRAALRNRLGDACPCSRYWAAVWLGQLRDAASREALETVCEDPVPTVRVAAHLALCLLGEHEAHIPELAALLNTPNLIVGLYAMNAIEQTGLLNEAVRDAAKKALENPYDGTQRYGRRLLAKCEEAGVA
ncbi:MAG: HEAT repeat domain-containing protein, partial [Candidatus Hydrogenedentota bacterium]